MSKLEDLLDIAQLNPYKGKEMLLQINELGLESGVFWIPVQYSSKFMCVCVCMCVCIHTYITHGHIFMYVNYNTYSTYFLYVLN